MRFTPRRFAGPLGRASRKRFFLDFRPDSAGSAVDVIVSSLAF